MPLLNSGSSVRRRRRHHYKLNGHTVGTWADSAIDDPYRQMLLAALQSALKHIGAGLSRLAPNEDPSPDIDVMVYVGPFRGFPGEDRLTAAVLLNQDGGTMPIDSVRQDDETGGYLVARHLIDQGCRDLAVVAGPGWHPGANLRLRGAIRACRDSGCGDPRIVIIGGFKAEGAIAATETILAARRRPQGIFYMNDGMALAGLEVLRRQGVALAIAGYDDIPAAAAAQLTTVRAPVRDLVAAAIELLERRLANPGRTFQHLTLRPQLIVRGSSTVGDGALIPPSL